MNFQFENDGIDHINIYSKGNTQLGRFLSNFTRIDLNYESMIIKSIEGYWYYLLTNETSLLDLYGFDAKQHGRNLLKQLNINSENIIDEDFKRRILKLTYLKLISNQYYYNLFKNNKLPFTHYYLYGNKMIFNENFQIEFLNLLSQKF